jgi:hypothetical protein
VAAASKTNRPDVRVTDPNGTGIFESLTFRSKTNGTIATQVSAAAPGTQVWDGLCRKLEVLIRARESGFESLRDGPGEAVGTTFRRFPAVRVLVPEIPASVMDIGRDRSSFSQKVAESKDRQELVRLEERLIKEIRECLGRTYEHSRSVSKRGTIAYDLARFFVQKAGVESDVLVITQYDPNESKPGSVTVRVYAVEP